MAIVTPEMHPLAAFGASVGDTVAELLARHGIELVTSVAPAAAVAGELLLEDGRSLLAERTVALPRLTGPDIAGLPTDAEGFIPVDEHGRVRGLKNVYAAGDAASWPVKQGGLAAQQADVVAESLAEWAGAPLRPTPFRPVLRGILLAGDEPLFLRADARIGRDLSLARLKPLWWPPAKVAGRYLAPYLAGRGIQVPAEPVPT
jgi:sulfide:quinone oxidoreductase